MVNRRDKRGMAKRRYARLVEAMTESGADSYFSVTGPRRELPQWQTDHAASRRPGAPTRFRAGMSSAKLAMLTETAFAEPVAAWVSRKCSTISSRRRSLSLRRKFRAFCSSWIALSISAREGPLIRSRSMLTSEGTTSSIFGVAFTQSRLVGCGASVGDRDVLSSISSRFFSSSFWFLSIAQVM
jgi:hypothetical protein